MGLTGDKIVNVLLESLTAEELEAALARKRGKTVFRPKPMTEKEELKEHYRKLIVSKGMLYPPEQLL